MLRIDSETLRVTVFGRDRTELFEHVEDMCNAYYGVGSWVLDSIDVEPSGVVTSGNGPWALGYEGVAHTRAL